MGSIVAGSTYLLAPPPKSYSHHHFIASFLCHPITQPLLLLQLQRKDVDTRHAFPQFDLVSRRVGRRARHEVKSESSSPSNLHPREVAIQYSETGEKAATIKYVNSLTSAQKRKAGIVPGDNSAIAVVYWKFTKSFTKVWTVHRYESKRKGHKVGYEFRLPSELAKGRNGQGYVYVRWTKKLALASTAQDRPSSVSSRHGRSSSASSIEGPQRRHTFPTSQSRPHIEPKWEFSSPNIRRIMASMSSQKLHIYSISSSATSLSSPSTSSFDDELCSDRELTTSRMFEMLIISGLFVGLEEDFASKLRQEFLSAGALRIPTPDERHTDGSQNIIPLSPKKPRSLNATRSSPVVINSSPPASLPSPQRRSQMTTEPKEIHSLALRATPSIPRPTTSYAAKGWGYMTGAANACVTKLLSLGA